MLRHQKQVRIQVQRVVDACLFALSMWLAHWVRSRWLRIEVFGGTMEIQPFYAYIWYAFFVLLVAPFLLELQGFYNRPLLSSRRLLAWQLLKSCTLTTVAVVSLIYLMRETQIARSVVLLSGAISFVLLLAKEQLVRLWIQSKVGQAQFRRRLIVVGTAGDTARLRVSLSTFQSEGIEIAGELDLWDTPVERLVDLLHELSPNGVVLAAQHTLFEQVERAIEICEREGVEVWLLADFFKPRISRVLLDELHGRPMLVFQSVPPQSWQSVAKRVLDVGVSATLLVLLAVPLAFVAAIIRVTSPGPVLFRQQRSGLNGSPFVMLKFRSMVSDAEQRKKELEVLNEMNGPVFKVTSDPRITPFGGFLRRYSIDEFPQLWNVLKGEMSLVGPRPLPVDEVKRFDDHAHRRRLSVKPGLTCLWQVSGRNDVRDFRDWVRLDLEYIDHWSFWLDLKILCRTVPVVLMGTGAR